MESGMQEEGEDLKCNGGPCEAPTPPPEDYYLPYLPGSKAEGYDWKKINSLESRDRTYYYPSMAITVKGVAFVSVKKTRQGHAHRLYTTYGKAVYMPAGWVALKWSGKFQF